MNPDVRGDILSAYAQAEGRTEASGSDRDAYMMYVEACMMSGKAPLTYPEWVKAGKPAK